MRDGRARNIRLIREEFHSGQEELSVSSGVR